MQRAPIYGLDVIRFVAALLVLFFHISFKPFNGDASSLAQRFDNLPPSIPGLSWGWIGVQIFFVISGLVISYSSTDTTARKFVIGRVARLFPAMLICSIIAAAVEVVCWGSPISQTVWFFVKSVTFWPIGPWLSGQFWTLGIEIFFYSALWCLVVSRQIHRLETFAWLLAIASSVYWLTFSVLGLSDPHPRLTQLLLLQSGCYFALGIAIFKVTIVGLTPTRVLLIILCALAAAPQIHYTNSIESPGFSSAVPYFAWAALCFLIAFFVLKAQGVARFVGGWSRSLRLIGLVTYPLYLVHMHVAGPLLIWMVNAAIDPYLAIFFSCSAAVASAVIIARYLEPPVHRMTFFAFNFFADGLESVLAPLRVDQGSEGNSIQS